MRLPRNVEDIVLKHAFAALQGETLEAIGLKDIHVKQLVATEFARVDVRDFMTDMLFELDDGTMFHMEYQSTAEDALYRFAIYDVMIAQTYRKPVRTIVLYTNEDESPSELNAGAFRYSVENVYLSQMDGDATLNHVEHALHFGEWTSQDRLRLSLAFYMDYQSKPICEVIDRVCGLIREIPDRQERNYTAALVAALGSKRLDSNELKRLMEVLKDVDMIKELVHTKAVEIAKNLMELNVDVDKIAKATGLSKEEIEEIRKNVH